MHDLDALIGKFDHVKLNGQEYKIPIGLDSMSLMAVAHGQRAQKAIQKLADNGGEMTQQDVDDIQSFVASAAGIPIDVVRSSPLRVLTELFALMFGKQD